VGACRARHAACQHAPGEAEQAVPAASASSGGICALLARSLRLCQVPGAQRAPASPAARFDCGCLLGCSGGGGPWPVCRGVGSARGGEAAGLPCGSWDVAWRAGEIAGRPRRDLTLGCLLCWHSYLDLWQCKFRWSSAGSKHPAVARGVCCWDTSVHRCGLTDLLVA